MVMPNGIFYVLTSYGLPWNEVCWLKVKQVDQLTTIAIRFTNLVPRLLNLLQRTREKRRSLVSDVTCVTFQVQGCPRVISECGQLLAHVAKDQGAWGRGYLWFSSSVSTCSPTSFPGSPITCNVRKKLPTLTNHPWTPLDLKCHARDIRYQAPPLFSRVLQKIEEPGNEVNIIL